MIILKCLVIWLVIALAETLHGIARVKFLNRRLGNKRARQITVVTGSAIIIGIAWVLVPWIGITTVAESLAIGGFWVVLMIAFDFGIGRFVFRMKWKRIAADFNPSRGGYLAFGMLALLLAPLIAAKWHGIL